MPGGVHPGWEQAARGGELGGRGRAVEGCGGGVD